jgi:cell division septal protein FtsQ
MTYSPQLKEQKTTTTKKQKRKQQNKTKQKKKREARLLFYDYSCWLLSITLMSHLLLF